VSLFFLRLLAELIAAPVMELLQGAAVRLYHDSARSDDDGQYVIRGQLNIQRNDDDCPALSRESQIQSVSGQGGSPG
jgi:hypothetical protein